MNERMFSFTQLRCFVAIADERHFGRAAARLHMTQSPLSRQLALLETALGVRLMNRNSRGVDLTVAGRVFYTEARNLLRGVDESGAAARLAAAGQTGHLSIGFTAASAYELLPVLIRDFRALHPFVGLSLKETVTHTQIEHLAAGRIDVGLVRPSFDLERFANLRLASDRLVAVIPSTHPLAEQDVIRIRDLHGQPMIGHSPTEATYFYDMLTGVFRAEGVEPIVVQSLAQPHTMLSMVRAGLGIAIVADLVRRHAPATGSVCRELKLKHRPPAVEMYLAWRDDNDSPALRNFVRSVRAFSLPAIRRDALRALAS